MANIPGITGYVLPGGYSLAQFQRTVASLPGGPTVVCILGQGRREEFLTERAVGGGADGKPVGFDPANLPDGRHFQLSKKGIVPGSLEVFINPKGDGTDLPLIQITSQAMADAWVEEFGDTDISADFGLNPDSVDGYRGASDGTGFFDSKYARQFEILKQQLGIAVNSVEPNHYIFDSIEGRIIFDQPLNAFDSVVVSYLPEEDLNDPEIFFSLQDVVEKHGYPTKENSVSLAAQVAFENGVGIICAVHAGWVYEGTPKRLMPEPTLFSALKALEKEELVEIIVPVLQSRVYNEIVMPFFDPAELSSSPQEIQDGYLLQEDPATGDHPGINISPLAVDSNTGLPTFLEVYKNGRLLQYGVDYSVPNLSGAASDPFTSSNVILAFHPSVGTHSVDNKLQEGDKIVVNYLPDPTVVNLVATGHLAALNHCQLMSQTKNRLERTCLLGAYEFVDLDFILDPITGIEANFGPFYRSMFFYPGGYKVTRVVAGEIQTLDAQYIAAAAAGYFASHPIQQSLTNKTLLGFTIPPKQKLSIDEANLVGGAGCAILAPLAAGGKVLHGRTTSNSGSPIEEEFSVIRISDLTAKTVRKALEKAYVGRVITATTPAEVTLTTTNILAALASQGVMTEFKNVNASVNPQDPRQVDVRFDIKPTFPLNWIFVKFTVTT